MPDIPIYKASKNEIISMLLSVGYSDRSLRDGVGKMLSKSQLAKKLRDYKIDHKPRKVMNDIEDEIGKPVRQPKEQSVEETTLSSTPNMTDQGWTQYVLGRFFDEELDGQNPRVEGLRRVASLLVGDIVEEGCELIQGPCSDNGYRACAKAWAVFDTIRGKKRFEALADACPENCSEGYTTYITAIADTRAKGRVYRNALYLHRVVAAEELSEFTNTQSVKIEHNCASELARPGQISMITLMLQKTQHDPKTILGELGIPYVEGINGEVEWKKLSYQQALDFMNTLRAKKA